MSIALHWMLRWFLWRSTTPRLDKNPSLMWWFHRFFCWNHRLKPKMVFTACCFFQLLQCDLDWFPQMEVTVFSPKKTSLMGPNAVTLENLVYNCRFRQMDFVARNPKAWQFCDRDLFGMVKWPFSMVTPWKFNIVPEKWWLEDYFPFGKVTFQGLC